MKFCFQNLGDGRGDKNGYILFLIYRKNKVDLLSLAFNVYL